VSLTKISDEDKNCMRRVKKGLKSSFNQDILDKNSINKKEGKK
jgi:hypothetical protein